MKTNGWFWTGAILLVGGTLLLAQYVRKSRGQVIHFTADGDSEKNFGAFPPDFPDEML